MKLNFHDFKSVAEAGTCFSRRPCSSISNGALLRTTRGNFTIIIVRYSKKVFQLQMKNDLIQCFLQVLRMVFGYEPYPGFNEIVKKKIDDEVKEWEEKKHKKIS